METTVTTETPPPPAPVVAVVEQAPSAEMLRMAEQAGAQTSELNGLREQVRELTSRLEVSENRPPVVERIEVVEAPEPEPEPIAASLVALPESGAVDVPLAQPNQERGTLARIFLGRLPAK